MTTAPLCLHCERAAQSDNPRLRCLRLCDRCGAVPGLRRIYRRPLGWTTAWDEHLQRMVERVQRGLPACIDDPGYIIPNPPDKRAGRRRRSRPRVFRVSRRHRRPLPE